MQTETMQTETMQTETMQTETMQTETVQTETVQTRRAGEWKPEQGSKLVWIYRRTLANEGRK